MDNYSIPGIVDEAGALDFLAGLVQIKSYSDTPGEAELATHLVEQMRALGLEAELPGPAVIRDGAVGRLGEAVDTQRVAIHIRIVAQDVRGAEAQRRILHTARDHIVNGHRRIIG